MTNPPSTAPDGATADSGGKLEASVRNAVARAMNRVRETMPADARLSLEQVEAVAGMAAAAMLAELADFLKATD